MCPLEWPREVLGLPGKGWEGQVSQPPAPWPLVLSLYHPSVILPCATHSCPPVSLASGFTPIISALSLKKTITFYIHLILLFARRNEKF